MCAQLIFYLTRQIQQAKVYSTSVCYTNLLTYLLTYHCL